MQTKSNRTSMDIRSLTLMALMTAILCILAPIAVPLPFTPIPISFTNLAIFYAVFVLGMKKAAISYLVYLLIGLVGLPVFSGFTGGVGKMAGPTGGYLIGFIFLTLIGGWFTEFFSGKRSWTVVGFSLGMSVCYLFGTVWLAVQMELNFTAALSIGVLPYIPGDIVKIIIAAATGPAVIKAVKKLQQ